MTTPTIRRRTWLGALLVLGCCLPTVAQSNSSEIQIIDRVAGLVPIHISGFTGEVDQVLRFDLEVAGFSLVEPDKAKVLLTGRNGTQVEGTLTDPSKRVLFARAYPGGTPRVQAHTLADDVVQAAIPGQKGIARTKIAFKHESGQRNGFNEMVSEIFLADYDGANAFQLTQDGSIARSPTWQPGQQKLFYTSYRPGRPCIFSHDLASGARSPISNFNGMNDGAAISPDGTRIAMVLSRGGSPDIWLGDVDGSNLRQLTQTREAEASPCWSPDGRMLCFSSSEGGATRLQVIDVAGGKMRALNTGGIRGATEPDWSPDGRLIAFTRMGGRENFQVYVVPAGGGEARFVGDGEDPSWAPNSRTLAVIKRKGASRILSLLDVPTGRAKDVRTLSGSCGQPSWAR
jgi:TolB protein